MLTVITFILDATLLIIGAISSITDLRSGKIYNKILKAAMLCGGICMAGYLILEPHLLPYYCCNVIAAMLVGFAFYKEKFWGAGDAKLWIVIVFLFPYHQYFRTNYMVIPSIHILMLIFVVAYCYVLAESVVLFLRGKRTVKETAVKIIWKDFFIQWLFGFFLISLLSKLLQMLLGNYFFQNQLFFSVLFLILIQWLGTKQIKRKGIYILCMSVVYAAIEWTGQDFSARQYIVNGIIILIVLFIGRTGAKYNYREIPTEEVKEGVVLSRMCVAGFQISRVKNLPAATDETTKSRITEEEAAAVKRWKDSKYGRDKIVIVSILPFAIFELLGVLIYVIAYLVLQK